MQTLSLISPGATGAPAANDSALLEVGELVVLLALENAKLTAAWADALRQLADARERVIQAGDVARQRLERDLHDGAQQRLTAIQVKLALAQEAAEGQDLARQLESIGADAAKAVDELRALARGIYPTVLRDNGLGDALRSVAREAPITVDVIDEAIGRCPEPVENAIYFCALEAVQNTTKHAGAGASITLRISRDLGLLRFDFADDGVGLDTARRGDGIGMTSMHDRIGAVGGELEVISSPGGGTTIRGAVPDRAGVSVL
ncbi:MAG TPA: histidine kinase, partial [Solirubrobacteraceae bacterium]|nr:histidine kinase [Solirubrobacteraceae bacterium]